ncbi:uncharacterized protein EV154DRAFT_490473 [Mucor mucedo]|uniref:uncharacterized protein n=1 Tax=Mucor mucedo TaxID=29922 RepID=UPI00221F50DF|nr:uncharacterized protein EV154DRAFT_490473 [Mucor mucedo]KAI7897104.1 hypothetical protein EV154DRAFT_490473 [Mucor mucedo]
MSFIVTRKFIQRIAVPSTNSMMHARFMTTAQPPPVSKPRQFMKKYGYVGIGVYLALGVVDLAATMGFITWKGANRVREVEDYVIGKAKGVLGMEHTPLDPQQVNEKPSLTSIFVIAYGIHKTLLLPLRLSLTAAVTPAVAKKLKSLGWVQNKINKK